MKRKLKRCFNIKRIISIICLTLYIGVFIGTNIDAYAVDIVNKNSKSQYYKAYFDKESAKIGDKVTFWVKMKENAIFNKIQVDFKADNQTFGYNNITLDYDATRDEYKTTIEITDDMPSGNWSARVMVYNGDSGSGSANNGYMKVTGTSKTINDYVPTVEWLKLNKNSVNVGEFLGVEMKLKSNVKVDISSAVIVYKTEENNTGAIINMSDYNSAEQIIKGSQKIHSYFERGIQNIREVKVVTANDDEYNLKLDQDLINLGTITINDKVEEEPQITSVSFHNTIYNSGETINIRVNVSNNKGDEHYFKLGFDLLERVYTNSSKYLGNGVYELELKVPYYIRSGYYQLREIQLIDVKTGQRIYSKGNQELNASIRIEGIMSNEKIGPEFKNVTINKTKFKPEEVLKIQVEANDADSYINSIFVSYKHERTGMLIHKDLQYNRTSNKYEGEIRLNNTTPNGKWLLNDIVLKDINGNITIVEKSLLQNGNFEVFNSKGNVELNKPVIKSIVTDKTSYKSGEIAKITADIDTNGVNPVSVQGFIYDKEEHIYFNYNDITGKYEAKYKMRQAEQSKYEIQVKVNYGYDNKNLTKTIWLNTENQLVIDEKPTITANDKTIELGIEFDPYEYVKALDKEDGDISSRVTVLKGEVNFNKVGAYPITYLVTDTYGNRVTKTINVTVEKTVKINEVKTDKKSAQEVGTKIKISTETLGENVLYEYFVKPVNGEWTRLSNYSRENYAYWTPSKEGKYVIRVRVKPEGSKEKYTDYKDINYTINKELKINNLTVNTPSGAVINQRLTVKADLNSSDTQCEFYVKDSSGKWTKLKGMGPKNYAYWTPEKSGEYTLRVRAKYNNSGNSYDAYKDIKFTVYNPIKITSLITNKPSGTKVGTKITVTAGPKLDDAYYEFYVKDASGKWTKLKGMGPKNYAYWTPEKAGKYTIRVRAKNIYSSNKYDSYKDISFTVGS